MLPPPTALRRSVDWNYVGYFDSSPALLYFCWVYDWRRHQEIYWPAAACFSEGALSCFSLRCTRAELPACEHPPCAPAAQLPQRLMRWLASIGSSSFRQGSNFFCFWNGFLGVAGATFWKRIPRLSRSCWSNLAAAHPRKRVRQRLHLPGTRASPERALLFCNKQRSMNDFSRSQCRNQNNSPRPFMLSPKIMKKQCDILPNKNP